MAKNELELARDLKNKYLREWRKKNKGRVRSHNLTYWERKANELEKALGVDKEVSYIVPGKEFNMLISEIKNLHENMTSKILPEYEEKDIIALEYSSEQGFIHHNYGDVDTPGNGYEIIERSVSFKKCFLFNKFLLARYGNQPLTLSYDEVKSEWLIFNRFYEVII